MEKFGNILKNWKSSNIDRDTKTQQEDSKEEYNRNLDTISQKEDLDKKLKEYDDKGTKKLQEMEERIKQMEDQLNKNKDNEQKQENLKEIELLQNKLEIATKKQENDSDELSEKKNEYDNLKRRKEEIDKELNELEEKQKQNKQKLEESNKKKEQEEIKKQKEYLDKKLKELQETVKAKENELDKKKKVMLELLNVENDTNEIDQKIGKKDNIVKNVTLSEEEKFNSQEEKKNEIERKRKEQEKIERKRKEEEEIERKRKEQEDIEKNKQKEIERQRKEQKEKEQREQEDKERKEQKEKEQREKEEKEKRDKEEKEKRDKEEIEKKEQEEKEEIDVNVPVGIKPGNEHNNDPEVQEKKKKELENSQSQANTTKNIIDAHAKKIAALKQNFSFTEKNFNENLNEKIFGWWEKAKVTINSPILVFLGLYQLLKAGKIKENALDNKLSEQINKVGQSFFMELENSEYESLNKLFISADHKTLHKIFKTIIERDSKFVKEKGISIYALLFLFNFNRKTVDPNKPLIPQLQANISIFGGGSGSTLANTENQESLVKICSKLGAKLTDLKGVYDIYVNKKYINDATNSELFSMKKLYNDTIVKNKSVITMVKRRDDWNNEMGKDDKTMKHHRFELSQGKKHGPPKENSYFTPLTLRYNDTPLTIAYDNRKQVNQQAFYTQQYDFYGFDLQFNPNVKNNGIATTFYEKYLKPETQNKTPEEVPSLCFIGYGQSGSGKTSTLIYLDVEGLEQDGILIETLKKIKPNFIKISMIEIYNDKMANKADESCFGITTLGHPKDEKGDGLLINCPKKTREPFTPDNLPDNAKKELNLRYVPIGEILDKAFDNEGKQPRSEEQRNGDEETSVTFKINPNNDGWLYTHRTGGEDGLEVNLPLKKAITNAFECREIGPSSNNKSSSRSHVAFYMECQNEAGETIYNMFVCDLAGVENEFDCSPGSTDTIRMIAKTLANKNYSRDLGKGNLEEWGKHEKHRSGKIVKYLHKDIQAGRSSETEPNCWPDGSPNAKGDIDTIADNFGMDLLKRIAAAAQNKEWKTFETGVQLGGTNPKKRRKKKKKKKPTLAEMNCTNDLETTGCKNAKQGEKKQCMRDKIIDIKNFTCKKNISNTGTKEQQKAMKKKLNEHLKEKRKIRIQKEKKEKKERIKKIEKETEETVVTESKFPTAEELYNFYEEKLEKLPVIKDETGEKFGFLRGNLQAVLDSFDFELYSDGTTKKLIEMFSTEWGFWIKKKELQDALETSNQFNEIFPIMKDWGRIGSKNASTPINIIESKIKSAFRGLRAPDCVATFSSGLEKACEIRRREGETTINPTLEQLTRDLKRISALSIKEKLSNGGKTPCIFADVFDDFTQNSIATDPLMSWYDIKNDEERKQDYGSILTAMCILGLGKDKINRDDKTNFLKNFKFCMTTVLNETFIMNFGDNPAKTAAGNYIYVNNPPLPPYLCVSKLERDYKRYLFYKYDPREEDEDGVIIDLKKTSTQLFLDSYYNLIIKMMTHPNYEERAIEELKMLEDDLILFENKEDLFKKYNKREDLKKGDIETSVEKLIELIKRGNNATFIGTLQTTSEVNRVSPSILLTKEKETEKEYSAIDTTNVNNQILKDLYNVCNNEKRNKAEDNADKKKQKSAILYECLYHLNKQTAKGVLTKRALSMKERDVQSIMVALESVFPLATRYINYQYLQSIWELVSKKERSYYIIQIDKDEGEKYPFNRDLCLKSWPEGISNKGSDTILKEIMFEGNKEYNISSNIIVEDIVTLCAKIKELIAAEPAPVYVKTNQKHKNCADCNSMEPTFRKFYGDIKEDYRFWTSFLQYFTRSDFYQDVYQQLIIKIKKDTEENKNYREVKPVSFKTVWYPGNDGKNINALRNKRMAANNLTEQEDNAWLIFKNDPDVKVYDYGWQKVSTGEQKEKTNQSEREENSQHDSSVRRPERRHKKTATSSQTTPTRRKKKRINITKQLFIIALTKYYKRNKKLQGIEKKRAQIIASNVRPQQHSGFITELIKQNVGREFWVKEGGGKKRKTKRKHKRKPKRKTKKK